MYYNIIYYKTKLENKNKQTSSSQYTNQGFILSNLSTNYNDTA